nr:MAG TPA: hypothetical protein [Caudoviricetes sp.]
MSKLILFVISSILSSFSCFLSLHLIISSFLLLSSAYSHLLLSFF